MCVEFLAALLRRKPAALSLLNGRTKKMMSNGLRPAGRLWRVIRGVCER
jgi:hypothetical protein